MQCEASALPSETQPEVVGAHGVVLWFGGVVFCYYCLSMAKSARKDFRDGAVVPFE